MKSEIPLFNCDEMPLQISPTEIFNAIIKCKGPEAVVKFFS
jgi:hypothetical protein